MKRKALLISLSVALVAMMALGVTLAYFTDTKTAANTFTVGNVKITLDEAAVKKVVNETTKKVDYVANANEPRVTENTYDGLMPGSTVVKDPTVTNVGESDAYIRVTIKHNNQNEIYQNITDTQFLAVIQGLVTDGIAHMDVAWNIGGDESDVIGVNYGNWGTYTATEIGDNEKVYVLYFTDPLAADKAITIFTGLNLPTTFTDKEMLPFADLKITITADAIQTAGFADVEAAFAAFDAQTTNP